jgi:hypothetical protein
VIKFNLLNSVHQIQPREAYEHEGGADSPPVENHPSPRISKERPHRGSNSPRAGLTPPHFSSAVANYLLRLANGHGSTPENHEEPRSLCLGKGNYPPVSNVQQRRSQEPRGEGELTRRLTLQGQPSRSYRRRSDDGTPTDIKYRGFVERSVPAQVPIRARDRPSGWFIIGLMAMPTSRGGHRVYTF